MGSGDEAGAGMARAGSDSGASKVSSACVDGIAGKAGRDGGGSQTPTDKDKSWAKARWWRWLDGWEVTSAPRS